MASMPLAEARYVDMAETLAWIMLIVVLTVLCVTVYSQHNRIAELQTICKVES